MTFLPRIGLLFLALSAANIIQAAWAADVSTVQDELRSLASKGILPELRWPDYSDYHAQAQKFYESIGYAPAWISDLKPTPQAEAMIKVFGEAAGKGLDPADYDSLLWSARIEKLRAASTSDAARFDLAMTVSVMRYISDLHLGKVNPRWFHFGFDVEHNQYDLSRFVRERLVSAPDLQPALATVEPPFDGYRRTERALLRYLQLLQQEDREQQLPIPKRPVVVGERYPGLQQLRRRLCLLGDLQLAACALEPTDVYTSTIADGVKHFQDRHGLQPDGRLDQRTIIELNVPLGDRVSQLQLTLERWRWLPHEFSQPPIVVNIPEFRLRALDQNEKVALAMNVVVGRAYRRQTPVFAKDMTHVIFRPYWNVPRSIERSEIVHNIERDRTYLSKKNFEVVTHGGQVVTNGPVSDDILQRLRDGGLEVRQRPGPKNSLGLVKLMFPNEYNVYLHDTPSPELFLRPRRDFSHGCIRVEKPVELTTWVLRNNPGWDRARVQAAMQTGPDNHRVNLSKPIPVLILYGTAVVDDNDQIHFFDDIYGHDAALRQTLAKGPPYPEWFD